MRPSRYQAESNPYIESWMNINTPNSGIHRRNDRTFWHGVVRLVLYLRSHTQLHGPICRWCSPEAERCHQAATEPTHFWTLKLQALWTIKPTTPGVMKSLGLNFLALPTPKRIWEGLPAAKGERPWLQVWVLHKAILCSLQGKFESSVYGHERAEGDEESCFTRASHWLFFSFGFDRYKQQLWMQTINRLFFFLKKCTSNWMMNFYWKMFFFSLVIRNIFFLPQIFCPLVVFAVALSCASEQLKVRTVHLTIK